MLNNNRNRNSNGLIGLLVALLKVLLWPLRILVSLLFPPRDTDGLSAAVTAKAAQQFVSYIRSLDGGGAASDRWSTNAFSSVQEDAISNQKLVFLYLHAPLHRSSKAFCEQVLNREPFSSYMQQDTCIFTGLSIHSAQGSQLASMLSVTSYPALAVLQPNSSRSLDILLLLEGSMCRSNQLMAYLTTAQHRHETVLTERRLREIEREEATALRNTQDTEYQQALEADRRRDQERQAALQAAETEAAAQAQAEQEEQQELERAKQALRDEPAAGTPDTTMIRFKMAQGKTINRRFHADETIGGIKTYLRVYCTEHEIEVGTIGLSTSYPRKQYDDSPDLTLLEAELVPQAVLMVQDLDA